MTTPHKITLKSPYPHEPRLVHVAEVQGRVLVLVYTMRRDAVRCMSFRYAERKEQRIYDERRQDYQIYQRGAETPEG